LTTVSRDTNFYYSFFVLPPLKRDAIIAVWDFCRAVDDAVDAVPPEGDDPWTAAREGASVKVSMAGRLAGWREELARCFDEREPQTPQGVRLKPYVARFSLPRQAFADLIDGVEMDLVHRRYETFEALYQYCLRVASAVGLICVEIFGYRDPRARTYAIDLGVALQLTNIIRDVSVDLKRGRLYLPLEDLETFGCAESDLAEGRVTGPVRALLAFECKRARSYYERAARDLPLSDARRLAAAEIMSAIYFEILDRIERTGYDVFSQIVRVPRPRRALIAARTWAATLLRSVSPAAILRA
jgi:phytoene synthase